MSLVAAWSLNNSVAEFAGQSALDLVLNGVTVTASGIDFSGSATDDARVAAANNTPLRLSAPFSIAFRVTTGSTTNYQQFIHSTDSANYSGYNLITNGSSLVEFMYGDNTANFSASRRSFIGSALSASTTYDIVVVVTDTSGTNTGVTMYINGASQSLSTSGEGGAMAYTASDTTFGNWDRDGTTRNSSHQMHKVGIFDHALSVQDVADFSTDPDAYFAAANSSFSVDTAPSEVVRGSQFNIIVSGSAVAATTGNTTVRLNGASGPIVPVNTVTGSDPYTITCTVPQATALQHNATGWPIYVEVDAESIQTGNIPFNPQAGYDFLQVSNPDLGSSNSLGNGYPSFVVSSGHQLVYHTNTTSEGVVTNVLPDTTVTLASAITEDNTMQFYFIHGDGTVGSIETFTFVYAGLQIVSINGGLPIANGATGVQVVVTEGASGVSTLTLNSVTQSFTAPNDTTLSFDLTWPNAMYGQSIVLSIDGSVTSNTFIVPSGTNEYVTLDGTYNNNVAGAITATPDLVAGDQLEYQVPSSNTIDFIIGADGIPEFDADSPGSIQVRALDSSDFTFGAYQTLNYTGAADLVPDQFDLGVDVNPAQPGEEVVRSFVVAGIEPATDVTFTATGSGAISEGVGNTTYVASTTAQLGDTINVQVIAGSFDAVVSGGVSCAGVNDSIVLTTRSAIPPNITIQPADENVTAGDVATFSVSATSATSYQWYQTPNTLLSGETSSSLNITTELADDGNQYYVDITSPEGVTISSNTAALTVQIPNVTITSPTMRDAVTKTVRASEANIPVIVRDLSRNILLQTTVTTDASGVWSLSSDTFGVPGDTVYVEFPDAPSGTYVGFTYVLT